MDLRPCVRHVGPALIALALCSLTGAHGLDSAGAEHKLVLGVVSSRPEAVSGDDVLVRLNAPALSAWRAQLDGRDVTALFKPVESSGELLALLPGLEPGKNTLQVEAGAATTRIEFVDHPLAGPIFSGPHQEPFICQTEANGLGPATDADCSAKTVIQFYYKSTEPVEIDPSSRIPPAPNLAPGFKIYDPFGPLPSDVASTVTSDGHTVPYVVRREVGTINRAVYDIEFLQLPDQPLPTPWIPAHVGWNGRLVYLVDGGCAPGYHQGTFKGAVGTTGEPFLAEGYATATATLNVAGNDCSAWISAETLSMVKEHFIKTYGKPTYTIGWGDSGGAFNQLLTAQDYPGLLDGLITTLSFPDPLTSESVEDCALLNDAFNTSELAWSEAQKAAVSGFSSWQTCKIGWSDGRGHFYPILDPNKLCASVIPKEVLYDRETNPKGVRCDLYGNEINIFGRNPRTGLAYRPLDNVGVQYGLRAFNRGQIDAELFIDLNKRVGGFDDDGGIIRSRNVADSQSVRMAYQRGLLLTGGGGLSEVPIIDWRPYADDAANNHDSIRSFITRARLIAANGKADNQVILRSPRWSIHEWLLFSSTQRWEQAYPDQAHYLVQHMDRWLANIAADNAGGILAARVARDKPTDLGDGCWATDGEHIVERVTYDGHGRCNQEYPVYADPRIAAGGPLTDDILKCSLKPISARDYVQPLSAEQLQRLQHIFPAGVCDYSRPGVGQEITRMTWQSYSDPNAAQVSKTSTHFEQAAQADR